MTEEQAREKYDVAIGKFNFAANGRAIASDAAWFAKLSLIRNTGKSLVCNIGPAAAELTRHHIIEMEITVEEMQAEDHFMDTQPITCLSSLVNDIIH